MRLTLTCLLYFLFFCSGLSGLIYQVVWVRVFGNVFGNTVYSASVVVAVFMLGLGVGQLHRWGARPIAVRRERRNCSLLRAYGYFELTIAAMGPPSRSSCRTSIDCLGARDLLFHGTRPAGMSLSSASVRRARRRSRSGC